MLIRIYDLTLGSVALLVSSPLLIVIYVVLFISQSGSPVFSQKRVGRNEVVFTLFKFRTMHSGVVDMPSHLINAENISNIGRVLRYLKLDELLQIINVLRGEMSFVGPRPCLVGQSDVIMIRRRYNIFSVRPGITGAAQLAAVDMSRPRDLARLDSDLIESMNSRVYWKLVFLSVVMVIGRLSFWWRESRG